MMVLTSVVTTGQAWLKANIPLIGAICVVKWSDVQHAAITAAAVLIAQTVLKPTNTKTYTIGIVRP